ncbi:MULTISPECIES: flagellar hook-length control protein FliK [Hyphomonas]|uniref:Flagellar hook-length control protein-like C-terminal domain-containing protein n=1 Tax=Hyphomonas adhaerens TaxID=81029 RepID=A0A3B9GU65_9PROT|nr:MULTISPECIES: flagellar hook-length control protein FliK [Hyphomonas]MBB41830.1 hypothetical protein [Hyphomonas sp.]HAE25981.1 hypothetical protein [Hyphomonas adhaerens]|tara:strand:- start:2592 stop:4022 length:1431 start_codon:yes stop_codon:yes gene_type:complete
MTFLIEPGLAFKQTNAKPDRTESKSPTGGSGDAFARSLQQERGTDSGAEAESAPQGKTTDTEQTRPQTLPPQDRRNEATAESEVILETSELEPSDEITTDETALNDTDTRMVQKRDNDPDTADFSEQDEDDAAPSLAGVLAAPEDAAKLPADPETSPTDPETSKNVTIESASTGNPEVPADIRPEDTPPAPEVQAMTVQAAGQDEVKQGTSRTSDKDALVKSTIEVPGSAAAKPDVPDTAITHSAGTTESNKDVVPDDGAKSPEVDGTFLAELSDGSPEVSSDTGKTGTIGQTAPAPEGSPQLAASALGASPAPQPASQPVQSPVQMTPTNAVVTASPAETVKIITDAVGSPDDTPDRITVQLDPPELGRVSIDFKFDAHGIQHVTVTGESPEAMRQLRLMHFELTQALERSGLSSQNMTFQQQQSGHQQSHTPASGRLFENIGPATDPTLLTSATLTADSIRPARSASGGLDIRL